MAIVKQLFQREYFDHLEKIGAWEGQDLSKIPEGKREEKQASLKEYFSKG